jgi:hypothetical protein
MTAKSTDKFEGRFYTKLKSNDSFFKQKVGISGKKLQSSPKIRDLEKVLFEILSNFMRNFLFTVLDPFQMRNRVVVSSSNFFFEGKLRA